MHILDRIGVDLLFYKRLPDCEKRQKDRDRCTHLGILFSEEVNEAKTTVGSTNPFLWQADCLQFSKRTE